MKHYLLPENGQFYKANMHSHTNISDGKLSPEEVKRNYKEKGYSIVAYTDHEVFVPQNALCDEEFLAINAVEVARNDGWHGGFEYNKSFHVNFYAKDQSITECPILNHKYIWLEHSKPYVSKEMEQNPYKSHFSTAGFNHMFKKANDAGFLVCLNHPVWSLLDPDDYTDLKGLWGIEVYNTGCFRCGLADTEQPMVDLLRRNERVVPIAADDNHDVWSQFGGWVMVKADKLDYATVMNALERGDFYASTGPEIKEMWIEDKQLHIKTSDVASIRLATNYRCSRAKNGSRENPINEITFNLTDFFDHNAAHATPRSDPWFRVYVTDADGNKAWTRAYFANELQ